MNTTGTGTQHHRIVIVGGGTAGISVAARIFKTLGQPDVAMIEPSSDHYYQPLWTLVGGAVFKKEITRRAERHLIPRGATWIQESVVDLCPAENCVRTDEGKTIGYDYLVVASGIQIDWGSVKGLEGSLGTGGLVYKLCLRLCRVHLGIDQAFHWRRGHFHAAQHADQMRGRAAEDHVPG